MPLDMVQLRTARHSSADVLPTNDRDLRRVEEIPVLLIDERVDF
jgi:predicted nucleic acid-binding protein